MLRLPGEKRLAGYKVGVYFNSFSGIRPLKVVRGKIRYKHMDRFEDTVPEFQLQTTPLFASWDAYGKRARQETSLPSLPGPWSRSLQVREQFLAEITEAEYAAVDQTDPLQALYGFTQLYGRRLHGLGFFRPGPVHVQHLPGLPLDGVADPQSAFVAVDLLKIQLPYCEQDHDLVVHELVHLAQDNLAGLQQGNALVEATTVLYTMALLLRWRPTQSSFGPGAALEAQLEYLEGAYRGASVLPLLYAFDRRHFAESTPIFTTWLWDLHVRNQARAELETRLLSIFPNIELMVGSTARYWEAVRARPVVVDQHAHQMHRMCGHGALDRVIRVVGIRIWEGREQPDVAALTDPGLGEAFPTPVRPKEHYRKFIQFAADLFE